MLLIFNIELTQEFIKFSTDFPLDFPLGKQPESTAQLPIQQRELLSSVSVAAPGEAKPRVRFATAGPGP